MQCRLERFFILGSQVIFLMTCRTVGRRNHIIQALRYILHLEIHSNWWSWNEWIEKTETVLLPEHVKILLCVYGVVYVGFSLLTYIYMITYKSCQIYKNAPVCPGLDGTRHHNLLCAVNVVTQPESTLPDIQSKNRAVRFLKEIAKTTPFFLAVGFHKPHVPYKIPREKTGEVFILKTYTLNFSSKT